MFPVPNLRSQYKTPTLILYTIVILAPEGYFPPPDMPEAADVPNPLASMLQRNTKVEAELSCIDYGLSRIIQSWMSLDQYLSRLLVREDFMHDASKTIREASV
jgi:hypothetical protein